MNAKKVKKLRALVRSLGGDPRDTRYVATNVRQKVFSVPGTRVRRDGLLAQVPVTLTTHTSVLEPDCGRAAYRRAKAYAGRFAA